MFTSAPPVHLTTPSRPAVHPVFRQASMALGTALSRLGTFPHDSRDSLPLKETELASFGVTWATDLAHETELAQELATSRLLRRADVTPAALGSSSLPVSPAPDAGAVSTPTLAVPAIMGVS